MAALGAQSIASSYEQLLHVDRDGGGNSTTHVSIKDGDNGTTFGFTIASDALMMSSTNRLEFGDTGTYIHQSADGVLDLVSDTEIEINATTIDMNGAVDISGNTQLGGTFTVGTDGSGQDVTFYSGTSGDSFVWDSSEEKLTITGTDGQTALDVADGNLVVADNIDLEGDIDVNGTSNLDNTDIDGTLAVDGTTISLDATTSLNIDNSNTSNGITIGTATSGVPISIGHTTSETTVNDNLVVTGDIDLAGSIDVDGTANLDAVDIDGAVQIDSTVTVGADDQGYDVIFYGDTASSNMTWDTSGDELVLNDARLYIDQDDNKRAIMVDSEATTVNAIDAQCDALTSGGVGYFYSNSSSTTARNLVQVINDNTAATATVGLYSKNDSENYTIKAENTNTTNSFGIHIVAGNDANDYTFLAQDRAGDENLQVYGSGAVRAKKTPAFLATPASNQEDVSANNAYHTVVFGTEIFDQGANFASSVFTAPVTGRYQLNTSVAMTDVDTGATAIAIRIVTSNRTYQQTIDPNFSADLAYYKFQFSVLADMDASDTAQISVLQDGGDSILNITTHSTFSGYLAC